MEFPFGHHGHRHHQRRDDDDEEEQRFPDERRPEYNAPPRRHGEELYGEPGYPPVHHVSHELEPERRPEYDAPPRRHGEELYGEPVYPPVHRVSHEVEPGYDEPPPAYGGQGEYGHRREEPPPQHHHPNRPSFTSHGEHEGVAENRKPTVRVFTKAKEDFSLTIRDGQVVLAPSDPRDEYQHWIKDMRYSTRVKDEEGFPSFALVNKVTGEAIKHSVGATHSVRLAPYNPDYLDESVLWTESNDTGEDFRCIRMVNNIGLNFDAFNGDDDHGGVKNGTTVVLWEWLKGKNQRWKIVPY